MSTTGAGRFLRMTAEGLAECGVRNSSRVLIALSGGPDSTALVLATHELAGRMGFEVTAAHFNHRTRGEGSDADETFCRELCEKLDVPIHVASFQSPTGDENVSEASMREARYEFLFGVATQANATEVATAHTMDDQAETALLALIRGAGLRGISGIKPVSVRVSPGSGTKATLIRPLLKLRKSDAVAFCAERGWTPREDQSNADLRYARNSVRHAVLPGMAKINPEVIESIARLTENLREDLELIDDTVARYHATASLSGPAELSRAKLAKVPVPAIPHVLMSAFRAARGSLEGLERTHVKAMAEAASGPSGKAIDLPYGVRMVIDHDAIKFVVATEGDRDSPFPSHILDVTLEAPFTQTLDNGGVLTGSTVNPVPAFNSPTKWQAALDPALANGRLTVRGRRDGDRFQPLGMPTPVKLQDFFVNEHVPERWRDGVPLIETERGIAWVAGQRIAEWAKVPEGAESALLLEYRPPAPPTGSEPASG